MVRVTSLLILMIGISACDRWVRTEIPCPFRPNLQSLTQTELAALDPDVADKLEGNQILLKGYARRLEARARCENTQ